MKSVLHHELETALRNRLRYVVTVAPRESIDWIHLGAGSRAWFDLRSTASSKAVTDAKARQRQAIELWRWPSGESAIWATWAEEWKCQGDEAFRLMSLDWTFYVGGTRCVAQPGQFMRANWDDCSASEAGTAAPQPHWHFDAALLAEYASLPASADKTIGSGDLVELGGSGAITELVESVEGATAQELSVAAVHLGMGGWANTPSAWQRQVADLDDVLAWADAVLVAALDQLPRIRLGEPI